MINVNTNEFLDSVYALRKEGLKVFVHQAPYGFMAFMQDRVEEDQYNIALYIDEGHRGAEGRDFIRACFSNFFDEGLADWCVGGIAKSNVACLKMLQLVACGHETTDMGEAVLVKFTKERFLEEEAKWTTKTQST